MFQPAAHKVSGMDKYHDNIAIMISTAVTII